MLCDHPARGIRHGGIYCRAEWWFGLGCMIGSESTVDWRKGWRGKLDVL